MNKFIKNVIRTNAEKYGINPLVVEAMIHVESAGHAYATRYESRWRWFLTTRKFSRSILSSDKTERVHQATSWGLMQVMGTVARELGFKGRMPELCKPDIGVKYGVMKLASQLKRQKNLKDALSAYNSGRPANKSKAGRLYAEKVMNRTDELIAQFEFNPPS